MKGNLFQAPFLGFHSIVKDSHMRNCYVVQKSSVLMAATFVSKHF